MLYLVNCEVVKYNYQGSTDIITMNHIVEADSEDEVKDKVRNYYENKDSEYEVSHWINFNYCHEVIT